MDLSVRPFAAVLVRAQLLLGAGCATEPATVAEPAPPAVIVAPPAVIVAPPAPPAEESPPPIAELAEPPVVVKKPVEKRVVIEKVVEPPPPPDPILIPDRIDDRIIRVAPTCGPCCHGAAGCDKLIAPDLDP